MSSALLLDTHVFIWLMEGNETLQKNSRAQISACTKEGTLFISAMTIWEIAMLQNKEKISLTLPLQQWVDKLKTLSFLKIIPIDADIALESCKLPGNFHGDPADRLIVATSRLLSAPLMTRDRKIIEYGEGAYARIVSC